MPPPESLSDERTRLAQQLNDLVVRRIAAIALRLDAAMALTGEPAVRRRIGETVAELNTVVRDLRATVIDLQRPDDADEDLRAKAVSLAIAAGARLGCAPHVTFNGPVADLDTALATDLLAALDEALTNVVRHSYAGMIDVRVSAADGVAVLEVRDDGVGPNDEPASGHGIAELIATAEAHGGSCRVTPNEPLGTLVRWSVPL
jgi:signal transduction histidine kinase